MLPNSVENFSNEEFSYGNWTITKAAVKLQTSVISTKLIPLINYKVIKDNIHTTSLTFQLPHEE